MRNCKLKDLSQNEKKRLLNRGWSVNLSVVNSVRRILKKVRLDGDDAVREFVYKFNGVWLNDFQVSQPEIRNAYKEVGPEILDALNQCLINLEKVCLDQMKSVKNAGLKTETTKGIYVWRTWRPVEDIGLYAPGGKAVYPSSVIMSGVPARVAGCKNIILCTPPGQTGTISPLVLVAADMVGIQKIYKVGGAEAIAAMAYGTRTIPKVSKIFGPGNQFVAEAKKQVLDSVGIDSPAGPSEVFIIADETANPAFIASDLLADGEHAENSSCILVTTSETIARQTMLEIKKQLTGLSTREMIIKSFNGFGLITLVDSLSEAVNFCNEYAPEHTELMVKNPAGLLNKITNSGSVFLGNWTAKASGDYLNGANHILPTGGFARMYSPLSVESFGRMMEVQKVTSRTALGRIKKPAELLARSEGLPGHANSISIRFRKGAKNDGT